jgi:hypothetical protein
MILYGTHYHGFSRNMKERALSRNRERRISSEHVGGFYIRCFTTDRTADGQKICSVRTALCHTNKNCKHQQCYAF